jgi:glycosyltransferase involved in cell wall biosynthesis
MCAAPSSASPQVSIVIPIYNEEGIVHAAVVDLRERLSPLGLSYEILLSENGSCDGTAAIVAELTQRYAEVRCVSIDEPNYGRALRQGILEARAEFVVCEEIDLCHVDFHLSALKLLRAGTDLVIGTKLGPGARDQRPWLRHAASRVYTSVLRLLLDFPGTDTHGLKAFRRSRLLPIVEACVVDRDVFASEFVIRAYRAGLDVREIPIRVVEMRLPSTNLLRRVPNVIKNLIKLRRAIRTSDEDSLT